MADVDDNGPMTTEQQAEYHRLKNEQQRQAIVAEVAQKVQETLAASGLDRYATLPPETRKLIGGMGEDDAKRLGELLKIMRDKGGSERIARSLEMADTIATLGKYSKWLAVSAVGLAVTLAGAATAFNELFKSFRGGRS